MKDSGRFLMDHWDLWGILGGFLRMLRDFEGSLIDYRLIIKWFWCIWRDSEGILKILDRFLGSLMGSRWILSYSEGFSMDFWDPQRIPDRFSMDQLPTPLHWAVPWDAGSATTLQTHRIRTQFIRPCDVATSNQLSHWINSFIFIYRNDIIRWNFMQMRPHLHH